MAPPESSYDELPYRFCAFPQVHPDRLAVVGRLYGLDPAPVERCRVLEIGCALGGNLLPMAAAFPDSRFLGIDLSAGQVRRGRAVAERLGLANLQLRAQDVARFDPAEGPFDYILCHGVYSWVPPGVGERILRLCGEALAEEGLATVSYNARPGWGFKSAVRDILRWGARGGGGPVERVARAVEYLRFVAENVFEADSPYGRTVREAAESLAAADPTYVFHEYLEEHNEPVTFAEFVERSSSASLAYVGAASLRDPSALLSEAARRRLGAMESDRLACEQTIDFLWRQTFRRDVLCRAGRAVRRWPDPAALRGMVLVGLAEPAGSGPGVFRGPKGQTLTTRDAALRAALETLHAARPAPVAYGDLLAGARRAAGAVDEPHFARSLLACAGAGLVEPHTHAPPIAARAGVRPLAGVVARWQAAEGHIVVNLLHRCHELDGFSRGVLALLDGRRDRRAICEALRPRVASGGLALPPTADGSPAGPEALEQAVEEVLDALAGLGMLTA